MRLYRMDAHVAYLQIIKVLVLNAVDVHGDPVGLRVVKLEDVDAYRHTRCQRVIRSRIHQICCLKRTAFAAEDVLRAG